ncbi:creatininase family protein [Nannocystis punicea]|uniref:Creatininase family protein n=1 Tax=Nannocystis punicea TaxID=2995304 RepID=A0ABY7GXB6_9BACT|nr:creatininase family protein [Nannocystis poenicansa]WAS91540.1 creatininase family protein [Nannocystis poenicansa]
MSPQELLVVLVALVVAPLGAVLQSTSRLFWFYLVTAAAMAVAHAMWQRRAGGDEPRATWRSLKHRSARRDYVIYVVNTVLLRVLPWIAVGGALASGIDGVVVDALSAWFGPPSVSDWSESFILVVVTLGTFVAADFALWATHYLQHRVGCLWELHKVHHSAEVLNPVSAYRVHPLDDWMNLTATGVAVAAFQGSARYLAGYSVEGVSFFGLNLFIFLFYALGFNLRHSHVQLHYPAWLSHLVISPAQHQIHHSSDPAHVDKNFGFALAIWDALAGTLYVSRQREELRFGLHNQDGERYESLWELYLAPIGRACRRVRSELGSAIAVSALLVLFATQSSCRQSAPVAASPTLYLEQMTWDEVRERLDAGFDTVLVPTGGVEQNGLHLALGKHNVVVEHAAGQIAEALGNTLIAPTIRLSPEGDISPPTGHMRYPGTISLPDEVFEAVLESAARSLEAHGFRLICLIGDSGGNQEPQRRVAAKLSREWEGRARVLHVSDYYHRNSQVAWLLAQGEDAATIGDHAGIRDTSEVLAVAPWMVRPERLPAAREDGEDGSSGDPSLASVRRGIIMLQLKTDAALAQIRRERTMIPEQR